MGRSLGLCLNMSNLLCSVITAACLGDLRHCAQYFGATKNGKEAECQYGDWMKATGSRARSPNSRRRYRDEAERATEGETAHSQQGRGRAPVGDDDPGRAAVAKVSMATQAAVQLRITRFVQNLCSPIQCFREKRFRR